MEHLTPQQVAECAETMSLGLSILAAIPKETLEAMLERTKVECCPDPLCAERRKINAKMLHLVVETQERQREIVTEGRELLRRVEEDEGIELEVTRDFLEENGAKAHLN